MRPLAAHDARSLGPALLRLMALLGAAAPISGCCAWPFEDAASGYARSRVVAMPLSAVRAGYRRDQPLPLEACTAACGTPACFPSSMVGATGVETAVVVCNEFVPAHCKSSGFMSFRMPSGRRSARLGAHAVSAFAALAEAEEASVLDFERLAADLRSLGAPRALLARVARARRDEVQHADAMRALARRHGGSPSRGRRARARGAPAKPVVGCPKPHPRPDLARFATEKLVVGCLGETWGATLLGVGARRAASPRARVIFGEVAGDEVRHAALAFAVHRWLWPQLSAPEQRRVHAALVRASDLLRASRSRAAPSVRVALGHPTEAEHQALTGAVVRLVRAAFEAASSTGATSAPQPR